MLVPHAWLWRGVSTRGPQEKASCSTGASCSIARRNRAKIVRHRREVQANSIEPAALQLAPAQRIESLSTDGSSSNVRSGYPGSNKGDGEDVGPRGSGERKDDTASSAKVLKLNIDLMLWRSRTSRIQARQTLNVEDRKQLYKAAEDGLRRCLALDPSDPRAYVVLGKTLMQQKRYDEARVLYQDGCANTGNNNPYIWSAWGWLEAQMGNPDRARKLYDAAVVVDNTHACAWHKWGMLEKNQGNYTRARDLWMQGIQRCRRKPQSQNAYLYNALACMAAQLGRVGEARSWFEEGTRTAEGAASVALWQAWGVLEATQGDPTAVRYLFRKGLQANPRSRYVHLAWALWERKQGNPRQCLALLQRGSQLNPTDPALYQAWALMEKRAGRIGRARMLFEQGLKADPSFIYLWQAYGVLEAEQGNLERARQLFQEGVWADPRSPDTVYVFHAWGCLEARAGNHQTARELFKAAVRVDPKNEITWSSWIAMESELGFVERADELRIRRAEQQWEFVVPPNFTTRPAPGLMDTLARFFSARGFGGGSGGGGDGDSVVAAAAAAAGKAAAAGAGGVGSGRLAMPSASGPGSLVGVLPEDYGATDDRLRFQDIERILESGDLSALPDFAAADDDVELTLQPPPAPPAGGARPAPEPRPREARSTLRLAPGAGDGMGFGGGAAAGLVRRPVRSWDGGRLGRPASEPGGQVAPRQPSPPPPPPQPEQAAAGTAGRAAQAPQQATEGRSEGISSSDGGSTGEGGRSSGGATSSFSTVASSSSRRPLEWPSQQQQQQQSLSIARPSMPDLPVLQSDSRPGEGMAVLGPRPTPPPPVDGPGAAATES